MFHKFIIKKFSISVVFQRNLLKWKKFSKRTRPFFCLSTILRGYKLLSHSQVSPLLLMVAKNVFTGHAQTNASTLKIIHPWGIGLIKSCMQLTLACFHPSPFPCPLFRPLWLMYRIFYVKVSSFLYVCTDDDDENDPAIYIEYHNKGVPTIESLSRLWFV